MTNVIGIVITALVAVSSTCNIKIVSMLLLSCDCWDCRVVGLYCIRGACLLSRKPSEADAE